MDAKIKRGAMMYKLEYVSDNGYKMNLNSFSNKIVVSSIGGLDGVNSDLIQTQGATQDGSTIQQVSVQPQTFSISGEILGTVEPIRQQFYRVFPSKTGGYLYYDDDFKKRVEVKTAPVISSHLFNGFYQLSLVAPYPYWTTSNDVRIDLVGMEAMFKFPVNYSDPQMIEGSNAHIFGKRNESQFIPVENNGHVPAKWKAIFVAKSEVVNPSISKVPINSASSLPQTIKIGTAQNPYTMQAGERITLDTTKRSVTVVSDVGGVEKNIFGSFDLNSDLFELDLGTNIIMFDADVNRPALYPALIPNYAFIGPARKGA